MIQLRIGSGAVAGRLKSCPECPRILSGFNGIPWQILVGFSSVAVSNLMLLQSILHKST